MAPSVSSDLNSSQNLVSLLSAGVFLAWTVTSFLSHYFTKDFFRAVEASQSAESVHVFSSAHVRRGLVDASVLTLFQIGLCHLLTKVHAPGDERHLGVARVCHVAATWLTNFSLACMFAASTFAIKLMEPITCAALQFILLGTPLSPVAVLCLPLIVGGAIIFSGNPITHSALSIGTAAAFTSTIAMALRNVSLKTGSTQKIPITISLKPLSRILVIFTLFAGWSITVWKLGYLPRRAVYLVATFLLSGVFHVIYSYVSTGIVLQHMSVVSHAATNISKRLLVVLLLYMTGNRSASTVNFLGLALCTLGLFIYVGSKSKEIYKASSTNASQLKLGHFMLVIFFLSLGAGLLRLNSIPKGVKSLIDSQTTSWPDSIVEVDRTFTQSAHELPPIEELLPRTDSYLAKQTEAIHHFLHQNLYQKPNRSTFLSTKLRTPSEIAAEAQRIHFEVLGKALQKFKYAMLLDIASFENKGDPCITVGEIYFLARIKLEIIYYCSAYTCTENNMLKAAEKAKTFSTSELVILVHGGGNVAGYAFSDVHRFFIFKAFQDYKILVFPQSIWVRNFNFENPHFKRCVQQYCCNENVTFVMRDHLSYSIAKEHFRGSTKFILAPDMAFQISPVKRFMSPVFDIMWIRRTDAETPGYSNRSIPFPPPGIRLHVSDWWKWRTPGAPNSLEKAHYICTNGFFYIQRGRVVITDRLHGHILATLLNIPHVLIDNKAHKLSAYHSSWTASLENTVITDDPSKALDLAVELLHKYNSSLPPRVPFLHIDEFLVRDRTFEQPELSYP